MIVETQRTPQSGSFSPTVPSTPAATALPTFEAAAELELSLGCPFDPARGISLARGVRADDSETEPTGAYEAAWSAGLHEHLVPTREGGRLASFETMLAVGRVISRRDMAVSLGFGSTMLATLPVWIWGSETQRRRVASLVMRRAWGTAGVSERAAGSDLLATATRATTTDGGYILNGEKWLVGNGRRSAFATVLAASDPSFGLFLVDFDAIGNQGVLRLPKVRTLGLRSHDLSGFTLTDVRLGDDAVLGRPGRGIEMVTGMLQITRTLVGGTSLGAADSALRIALRHARERRLYGGSALTLSPVRSLIAQGFADMLVAECTALAAARALDVARERMALWSAVSKYVVPLLCVQAVNAFGEVLSARAYLREGIGDGAFQKIQRDLAITPVFEGTQLVQLDAIRAQLTSATRRRSTADGLPLATLFGFGAPVTSSELSEGRPSIIFGNVDEVMHGLDQAVELISDDAELAALGRTLLDVRNETRAAFRTFPSHRTPEGYEAARRHSLVHAGACCLHTWCLQRKTLGALAADRAWLSLALRRVVERLGMPAPPDREAEDRLVKHLSDLDDDDRAFSLIPLRLAPQHREAPIT